MGQCASARAKHGVHPKPSIRRRSSIRSATGSIRMSFSKKRPTKRHLSASYQVPEDSPSIEKMDVNAATEEELMTISGIDRALAKNIVNYRDLIGGFRRVEDVALVSGLGAAKFASIRDEICVGSRKRIPSLSSSNSVSNPEQKSVSSMSGIEMTAPTRLDLNQATIFELMSVRGLNQELAANIVYHREKKGPFRCVEDVRKVKGVSRRRAALLKNLLSVDRNAVSCLPRDSSSSTLGCASSQTTPRVAPRRSSPKTKRFARHRRTKSAPTKLSEMINLAVGTSVGILHFEQPSRKNNGFSLNGCQAADNASSPADINRQMYDLLSMKSWPRPIMEEVFLDMRKGNSAFRLATWNFHGFSPEKAENPGVREVICRTILENGLTLIAVQEISCLAVLEKICQELNAPSLRKVIEWDGPRGDWRCWIDSPEAGSEEADWMQRGLRGRFRVRDQSSSSSCDSSHVKCDHVGFLYDSSRGIRLRSAKPFLRSRPPSSAVSSHEESKRRTSSFQLDNINPAFLEYCLAVGNFELEGTEMCLVTAYIRPWGAMQKASPGARQRERVPTIKKVPVVDPSPTSDPRDSPVRSEKDSPDTTASTSPVAQLKEKILGKMDLRRALSIVASDLKSSEVDLALAQARAGLGMIKETLKSQLDLTKVVIMGDTGMSLADPVFEDVQELALTSIVGATTCTTANGRCVPKDDVRCYDNICLSENMKKYFTGHWSIVRQGLDHLAIPRGWGWGGLVSNHCPVWAELYTSVVPETPSSEAGQLTHDVEISDVLLHTRVNGVLPPAKPLCNGLNGINNNPCIISLSEAN